MAVLRYYNPVLHDLYHYNSPDGLGSPDRLNMDCQSVGFIDWSGTKYIPRQHYTPAPTSVDPLLIPYDSSSINFWNPVSFNAVVISPRHILCCEHFRGSTTNTHFATDPSYNSNFAFIGRSGTHHFTRTCTKVYLSVGHDLTLLEYGIPEDTTLPSTPLPEDDMMIYNKIADPHYMPIGTPLWSKDGHAKIYKHTLASVLTDTNGEAFSYHDSQVIDGVNDWARANSPYIFTGDSGTPVMATDSQGRTIFVGFKYLMGFNSNAIRPQTVAAINEIMEPYGYSIEHVRLSPTIPSPLTKRVTVSREYNDSNLTYPYPSIPFGTIDPPSKSKQAKLQNTDARIGVKISEGELSKFTNKPYLQDAVHEETGTTVSIDFTEE